MKSLACSPPCLLPPLHAAVPGRTSSVSQCEPNSQAMDYAEAIGSCSHLTWPQCLSSTVGTFSDWCLLLC